MKMYVNYIITLTIANRKWVLLDRFNGLYEEN